MNRKIGRRPRDREILAVRGAAQGPLYQERAALIEAEITEVYEHRATAAATNGSRYLNRSTARESRA